MDFDRLIQPVWPVDSLFCVMVAVVAAVVWWQCCVSFRLLSSTAFTPAQKWAKAALLWLFPVVGTYAVHHAVLIANQCNASRDAASGERVTRAAQEYRRAQVRRRRKDRRINSRLQREGVSTQS